jgi:hypothetical protein
MSYNDSTTEDSENDDYKALKRISGKELLVFNTPNTATKTVLYNKYCCDNLCDKNSFSENVDNKPTLTKGSTYDCIGKIVLIKNGMHLGLVHESTADSLERIQCEYPLDAYSFKGYCACPPDSTIGESLLKLADNQLVGLIGECEIICFTDQHTDSNLLLINAFVKSHPSIKKLKVSILGKNHYDAFKTNFANLLIKGCKSKPNFLEKVFSSENYHDTDSTQHAFHTEELNGFVQMLNGVEVTMCVKYKTTVAL